MRKTWFKHFLTWQAERWYFLFWVLPRRFDRKALPTQKVNCTDFFLQFTLLMPFWKNSQLHCWMAFTVLVEEWLHRCVRLNRHPEIFFPGKSPWTWNCTLAWPLHCTSLGSIVICFWWWARCWTQLFELWTRPVETDTAKYIFLVSANDFFGKIATHGGNTPSAHHNKLVNFSYFVVKHTSTVVV